MRARNGLKENPLSMVHFFGGVLSSLMGCFPLSAMALGFSPLEQEGEDVK
jgi:hypothetical protein